MGSNCHFKLPQVGVRHGVEIQTRERHRLIAPDVPSEVAAKYRSDVFLGHGGPAKKRIPALPAYVILARPLGVEVDCARVIGNLVMRPIFSEPVRLADS